MTLDIVKAIQRTKYLRQRFTLLYNNIEQCDDNCSILLFCSPSRVSICICLCVWLSVCISQEQRVWTSPNLLFAYYLQTWLGHALRYIMCFRSCGWRHICTLWQEQAATQKERLVKVADQGEARIWHHGVHSYWRRRQHQTGGGV